MKYLAIILLSLTALTASRTPAGDTRAVQLASVAPALIEARAIPESPAADGALGVVLATALVALQLRRRQKSMRMPRAFYR